MSLALIAGFVVAYPMNWWLVSHRLKHGMMTVRPAGAAAPAMAMPGMAASVPMPMVPSGKITAMAAVSFLVLAAGLTVALAFGGADQG
jgi:hypothetical protein